MSQESRRAMFDRAALRWCACGCPSSNDQGDTCVGSEDFTLLLQDLDEGKLLPRWMVLTTSGDHVYVYLSDTLTGAKRAGVENIGDSAYPETPVAIVDLDTGAMRRPNFREIRWKTSTAVLR